MPNDTSTLSGALLEMKDQLISELADKGVTASYDPSTGLLGLIGRISDIQTGGSCYHIELDNSAYTTTGSLTVTATLQNQYQPYANQTVTFTGGTSTVTATTDSNGVATATVTFSASGTLTASYSNVSDTATVTVQTYIFYDDASTDNSSTLFGSSISLRNNGTATTSYVSASPPYYIIKNTRGSAEAFVPYTDLEGITDSFKLSIESAMHSTSNVCLIGLYYYQDSNNWGGVKAINSEQWISSKTNGTFTEQSYQSGQSASTTKIRTEMVFDSSANTLTISTYNINNDTLIQTKTMNIPITLDSSVKWGTTTTWSINAQHDVYNIKAEYI